VASEARAENGWELADRLATCIQCGRPASRTTRNCTGDSDDDDDDDDDRSLSLSLSLSLIGTCQRSIAQRSLLMHNTRCRVDYEREQVATTEL